MELSDRPKWKHTAIACLCILGILLLVGGSYAAYTRQAYQKGVARNRDTETVSFTSNYMQLCSSDSQSTLYTVRNIAYGENDKNAETVSFDIYVYNYANGNTGQPSERDIPYTMKIEFADGSGPYTVAYGNESKQIQNGETYTANKTLIGRDAKEHKYTITIPGKDLDQVKITATATPDNTALTNNKILAAILRPCTSNSASSFRASGDFIDKNVGVPTDYDGFNYEVSISGGSAQATLTWDKKVLEIDRYFLEKIGITDTEKIKNIIQAGTVSFKMDQTNGTGDYLIPFYIKDKTEIPATWLLMKNLITFSAEQDQ